MMQRALTAGAGCATCIAGVPSELGMTLIEGERNPTSTRAGEGACPTRLEGSCRGRGFWRRPLAIWRCWVVGDAGPPSRSGLDRAAAHGRSGSKRSGGQVGHRLGWGAPLTPASP